MFLTASIKSSLDLFILNFSQKISFSDEIAIKQSPTFYFSPSVEGPALPVTEIE